MTEIYLGEPPEYIKNWMLKHQDGGGLDKPLRFTAAEAGASVCLNRMLSNKIDNTTEDSADKKLINLQYSLNGGSWGKYTLGTAVNLDENGYVEFKALGSNETISKSTNNYYQFAIEKKVMPLETFSRCLSKTVSKTRKMFQLIATTGYFLDARVSRLLPSFPQRPW